MRLTKIEISYTVSKGSSGDYSDFDVCDVFYLNSSSPYLKDEDGLERLRDLLIRSSTRGGGVESAIYSNIVLTQYESRRYSKRPKDHGAAFYLPSIMPDSLSTAHALDVYEINSRDIAYDLDKLKENRHELEKGLRDYRARTRRYASSSKLHNALAKSKRAEIARAKLIVTSKESITKVKESEEYKNILRRKKKANDEVDHLKKQRRRYREMISALNDELKTVKAAQSRIEKEKRAYERKVDRRYNSLKKEIDKRRVNYRAGKTSVMPKNYSLTDREIRKLAEDEVNHEERLLTDSVYAKEHREQVSKKQEKEAQRAAERLYRLSKNTLKRPKN